MPALATPALTRATLRQHVRTARPAEVSTSGRLAGGLGVSGGSHCQVSLPLPARPSLRHCAAAAPRHSFRAPRSLALRCAAADAGPSAASPSSLLRGWLQPLDGLWGKLLLMGSLFFFMAYNNALLDSLKDTLVVTALGGAEQIPYLTVWAVLPCSVLFVLVFSVLSQRLPRKALFDATVSGFLAFYLLFTFLLFPLRAQLAPAGLTQALLAVVPAGLHGGVAVLHNWPYTLFYVFSELWGDVVLSLLFWGLANEITAEREAMVLYPLFGLGANLAQAAAGRVLKGMAIFMAPKAAALTGLSAAAHAAASSAAWDAQLRLLMLSVFVAGAAILVLHAHISSAAPAWMAAREPEDMPPAAPPRRAGAKPRSTMDVFKALSTSPQINCLAAMAVAQGLSSNIFAVAWKTQLRMLYPDPSAYSAFMGDVATISACATGAAMLAAPMLFRKLGWAGAAAFTPWCMIAMGWAFFGASIAGGFGAASGGPPLAMLHKLVMGGALVYVFEKASKFSLFKPAEEMVYLGLSQEARTQGKAAVDVCATQVGKAGGSIFQQGLLVAFGSLARALPALALCHTACVTAWIFAVSSLSFHHGHLLGKLRAKDQVLGLTAGPACDLEDAPCDALLLDAGGQAPPTAAIPAAV